MLNRISSQVLCDKGTCKQVLQDFQPIKEQYGNHEDHPKMDLSFGDVIVKTGLSPEDLNRRFAEKNLPLKIRGPIVMLEPELVKVSFEEYCDPCCTLVRISI